MVSGKSRCLCHGRTNDEEYYISLHAIMANTKYDEESLPEKYDLKQSTEPTAAFPTTSIETTPLWIHPKQSNNSAVPPAYTSRPRRSLRMRPSIWSWAALLAFFFAIFYLYGFSEFDLPGSDSISILRSKHNRLRIEKLPSKFLPQTGKHRTAGRLIIVGDVHGMKNELDSLLEKVKFSSKHDHLILAGDMIDKGPDSPGVIDLAMEVGATCVMGNHEHKAILDNTREFRKLGKKRGKWIKSCPQILRVGSLGKMGEVVVVHAGLMPGKKLRAQSAKHVMNMRTIDKHGKPSSRKEGVDWFKVCFLI